MVTPPLRSPWLRPKMYATMQITLCNTVTSPLRSLLPSPVGDRRGEVPLYFILGAIQVLCNAVGVWGVSTFLGKSIMKVYSSMLLALRGGWLGVIFPGKKRYVTLKWFHRISEKAQTTNCNYRNTLA